MLAASNTVPIGRRPVGVGVLAALGTAVVIGIPTDVLPNPWFGREIGVRPLDVVVLVVLSLLTGALAATYVVSGDTSPAAPRAGIGSGILGWFAVGCPLCNKLVVGLIGASGATSVFEPLQPALGVMAVGLAAAALFARVRAIRRASCAIPAPLLRAEATIAERPEDAT
jgi:hypothetical protein